MLFNTNQYIKIKLTSKGRDILKRRHEDLMKALPGKYRRPFEVNEDKDGWYRDQLWSIMQTFGSHIHMGGDLPFETEIMI